MNKDLHAFLDIKIGTWLLATISSIKPPVCSQSRMNESSLGLFDLPKTFRHDECLVPSYYGTGMCNVMYCTLASWWPLKSFHDIDFALGNIITSILLVLVLVLTTWDGIYNREIGGATMSCSLGGQSVIFFFRTIGLGRPDRIMDYGWVSLFFLTIMRACHMRCVWWRVASGWFLVLEVWTECKRPFRTLSFADLPK